MAAPIRLIQDWHALTGKDTGHSTRINRVLQMHGLSEVGKRGKAAELSSTSLCRFLLADVTGDSIADAADRAKLWGGLVKDRSRTRAHVSKNALSEADKAFRERMDLRRSADELVNVTAVEDILPGTTLLEGIKAMLDAMSDLAFNVVMYGSQAPFTQVVSHMQFKIELRVGDSGGPVAIVSTSNRQDRYSLVVEQTTARCPVKSVITIEVPHLVVLAHLWADTKALQGDARPPSPPDGSASPAGTGSENENAEAIPTASAPTLNHSSNSSDRTIARTAINGTLYTPDGSACACADARAVRDDILSTFVGSHANARVRAESGVSGGS